MMVVADTSPVNYLLQIGEADLLPTLFERVLLPQAVLHELSHPKAHTKVKHWAANLPAWVEVRAVQPVRVRALLRLEIGEREAIQLVLDLGIDLVLLDEADGRRQAELLQLEVRGTLGILEHAARKRKTNFRNALEKLERTNFRISALLRNALLLRNP